MVKRKRRHGRRTPKYPVAPTAEILDDYLGTKVADPFRPLEHAHDAATLAWVEAQNELTRSLLDRPEREQIRRRLTELFDYPRISPPILKKHRYFFSRNEGLQNQPVYYVQEGLNGAPRILIDPNELSPDGTVAVTNISVSHDAREVTFGSEVSHDGRYLTITVVRGTADESEVFVLDRTAPDGPFAPIFTGFKHKYVPQQVIDGTMFLLTNHNAPRGRVIAVDIRNPAWIREVIPEAGDQLEWITMVHRRIIAHYLHDASSVLMIFDLDGHLIRSIDLPGIGSVGNLTGELDDAEMFFSFQSFTRPPTIYRYDFTTGELTEFHRTEPNFDPEQFSTVQVWYRSKDGTPVSMFLSSRKGLRKDQNTPAFLYGYGGFNIPMTPFFNPVHFYFMERGGIFAVANLRGGSECGEQWHRAGMLGRKQNVFDDFAAAAEWLVSNGYTRRQRLAISGRSNGGLLAAASMIQRPDLFRAVVVQVPVLDMLRYHRFTLARAWIPEYGSSEDPEQFKFLYAYSPLHNVRDGHSSGNLGTGGKPVSKLIEEWADIWTFVLECGGLAAAFGK